MRWSRGFLDGLGNTRFPNGWAMHYYTGGRGRDPALQFTLDHMNEQFAIYWQIEEAIVYSYATAARDMRHVGLMLARHELRPHFRRRHRWHPVR